MDSSKNAFWLTWILKRRTALALTLGLVFIAVTMIHESRKLIGLPNEVFWNNKLQWRACADWVLAGDSRVNGALAPSEMSSVSPGLRIRNFGFRACGYRPDYLEAVENVLDPESDNPAIILGVSPRSLTQRPTSRNEFQKRVNMPRVVCRNWEQIMWTLKRRPLEHWYALICHSRRPARPLFLLYPDGWAAGALNPERPEHALKQYRREFTHNNVDPDMIADTLECVKRWTRSGVRVYGFRTPAAPAMIELENELSGFDETAFVESFTQAGGVWLAVNQTGYHSYDGSHLRWDAALQFSRDLAEAAAEAQKNDGCSVVAVRCGFNPILAARALHHLPEFQTSAP